MLALAATIGLAGCEGADGKDGLAGTPGTPGTPGAIGPTGPTGPAGPTGPSAKVEPRESCGVCHANGSSSSATAAHALDREVKYTVIAPPAADGADLVVRFNIKVNGVNYDFFTVPNRAVIFNGVGSTYTQTSVVTAPTTVQSLGAGNYLVRIAGRATSIGTDSRYYFRLGSATGVTPARRASVYANDAGYQRLDLVSNQSCQNCHSTFAGGLTDHHYNPFEAGSCIACHSASNPPQGLGLAYLAHGIHNSHNMPTGEFVIGTPPNTEEFSVTYPTYTTNCGVCHDSPAALAKANAMPVTGPGCFSCHESMKSWDFTASGTTFHESMTAATNCQTCHNDTAGAVAANRVTAFHNGIVTERGGIIWGGLDTSVTEGAKFAWTVTNVVDNGTNLAISWAAKYNGVDVNPCNVTVGPGAPAFHAIPALPAVPPATTATNRNNLSVLRSYVQGDDYVLGQDPNAPGQAVAVNVTTTNTACAGSVATTTIPVDAGIPAGTRGVIAVQGKPWVVAVDPADTDGVMQVRAKTPTREYVVGTGAKPATERRAIADTTDCLKCHVGSLYQHGGNRVDNVTMCVMCHNSASTEQNVRVGMGVDKSEAYDRLVGQTYEFKTMLHAIHKAGEPGSAPIVIYRNRGIYAWGTDKSLLPNWATGAKCDAPSIPGVDTLGNIVFGSDPASANKCQAHTFHTPTYPRLSNDCAACHVATFNVIPDQSKAVATTLDAGGTTWKNQLDDTLQGASAAACTSCHSSTDAKGHAYQNGWTPQVFPNGRQTILDTK